MRRSRLLCLTLAAASAACCDAEPTPDSTAGSRTPSAADRAMGEAAGWPSWRGPTRDGVAHHGDPPTTWSEDDNIRWKVELPGEGSSSPIIWGDRVYLTTAIETGREGPAREQADAPRPRSNLVTEAPTTIHEFAVLAVDRADGGVAWKTVVAEAVPHEGGHATATQASASATTDGQHIIAHFGSRGLHCLDMNGEVQWSKEFGQMDTLGFGEGSSPALHEDTVVMTWDHQGDSFIAAFDKHTGTERWRQARDEPVSWATPFIVSVDGADLVVTSATNAARAYDLANGALVWSCGGMTANCIPTPVHRDGVIYLMSGFRGDMLQAIRLAGASGDITGSDHVIWRHRQGTSYTPSALLYGDRLYFLRKNNGVLSCLDRETGEAHYQGKRLPGMRQVYSSPVGAAGRVYVTSRGGKTVVLEDGDGYVELATNQLDDGFDASPAIVGGELYLRGQKFLYCIAED